MDKSRSKKLFINSTSSLANQIITLICGFILPRLILNRFGSDVNGLVNSINQFLGLITFLDLGVGTVVTSSLYKPLAENDTEAISRIYVSAKRFFRNIAIIYVVYLVVITFIFPLLIAKEFGFWYTSTLILAISITLFAQYYFGIVYQLLLNADQKSYVPMFAQSVTLIVNTIACALLIKYGASIQIVKFVTSLVFLARPLTLFLYVSRHYRIDKHIEFEGEPIKQKWNGLAQHLSYVVLSNTDSIVLTLFSSLSNVSIYGVYHLVVNGVKMICQSLTSGVTALFGNMLAKKETKLLESTFDNLEWIIHTSVTLMFTICGILIVPFVKVYTLGVTDANYAVPVFAILITMAQGAYCLRLPYNMVVLAAGHYKQTQTSSIIEMLMNIVLSIVLVINYGLVGVAIGTLAAMAYRTVYLAWYLSNNIINRRLHYFIKHILVDSVCILLIVVATLWIRIGILTYSGWFFMAIKVSLIALPISFGVNMVFFRQQTKFWCRKIFRKVRKGG